MVMSIATRHAAPFRAARGGDVSAPRARAPRCEGRREVQAGEGRQRDAERGEQPEKVSARRNEHRDREERRAPGGGRGRSSGRREAARIRKPGTRRRERPRARSSGPPLSGPNETPSRAESRGTSIRPPRPPAEGDAGPRARLVRLTTFCGPDVYPGPAKSIETVMEHGRVPLQACGVSSASRTFAVRACSVNGFERNPGPPSAPRSARTSAV